MAITGDFFERIQEKDVFIEEAHIDFYNRSEEMGVLPQWNQSRAQDAFFQWMQDLERIECVEDKVGRPDHLKCAAHMIYWLRRSSPVSEFTCVAPHNEASVEFMLQYGREYLALDFGYRAAQLYERKIMGRGLPETSFTLQSDLPGVGPNDFIQSACHVLKLKNVSPHALLLVLKAIFLRP